MKIRFGNIEVHKPVGLQACGAGLNWKEHCQVQSIFVVEENISWYKKWEGAGLKSLRLTVN